VEIKPEAIILLGRSTPLHPWLHIDAHGAIVSRMTDVGTCQLVTSDRATFEAKDVKEILSTPLRPYHGLHGRWPDADVEGWRQSDNLPSFSEVLSLTMAALERAVEFPRPEQRAFMATWIMGTYFFPIFLAYPRLSLAGEKGSGKSKVMTVLSATAFNALLMVNPTPAVLYRLVQEYRPTLLLDEVEGFSKEDAREILAIVNSGYKAGAIVPRCEGKEQKRVESFQVYAPLALAAIRSVNGTTEDRCIPLVLTRGLDPAHINAEVDPADHVFTTIRSGCYRLLLTRSRAVREAAEALTLPDWLVARARELWKPLLTIAAVVDQESGLETTRDLLRLAREHVADREDLSDEGAALMDELTERLNGSTLVVRPGDLAEPLQKRLGWKERPTPRLVGSWLKRYGFSSMRRDKGGIPYEVTAEKLELMKVRYTPLDTYIPTSSPANS
jgi:hypothetical protein